MHGGVVFSSILFDNIRKLSNETYAFLSSVASTTSDHMWKYALKCSFSLFGPQISFSRMFSNVVVRSFIFLCNSSTWIRFTFSFNSPISCLNFSFLRSAFLLPLWWFCLLHHVSGLFLASTFCFWYPLFYLVYDGALKGCIGNEWAQSQLNFWSFFHFPTILIGQQK